MLQAHSLLWNYLWVAPNLLLLVLAFLLWKRRLSSRFRAFFIFAIVSGLGDLAVFAADVHPSVSPENFWRVDWLFLLIESLVKFVVIAEVFSSVLSPYASVSKLGKALISGVGATMVFLAALLAAFSQGDSGVRLIAGFHVVEQTIFVVELGLIVFIFAFAAYFRLPWNRSSFGILFGFGLSTSVYLATWAITNNADPFWPGRTSLDFLDMSVHHVCVLIWFYYLLVPQRVAAKPAVPLPESNLDLWNRELKRLLQQ